jgi:hypothetical protein
VNSRKPLALEVELNGHRIILVNVHLRSKRGDDPVFGRRQPPREASRAQRHSQAEVLRRFVRHVLDVEREAKLLVLGDFNDFEFSETLGRIASAGLNNLTELVVPTDRYTYNYRGNAQMLDHVLASPALSAHALVSVLHIAADRPAALRPTDHDPVLVSFELDAP